MKGRYSFVGKKRTIKIDEDIWTHSLQYVKDQLAILKRYSDSPEPPLTRQEEDDLTYDVARHPQQIRNLRAQIERKKVREEKKKAREERKKAREIRWLQSV